MTLDLTAIAQAVTAVLDAHGVTERICEVFPIRGRLDVLHIRTNDGWLFTVDQDGIEFRGAITPVSFAVLTTVWARFTDQPSEEEIQQRRLV